MKKMLAYVLLALMLLPCANASGLTEKQVIDILKSADASAAKGKLYIEQATDHDGAWIFSSDGWEDALFSGSFYHVTRKGAELLGKSEKVFMWGCHQTNGADVFYSATGEWEDRRIHAAVADLNGKAVIVEGTDAFVALETLGGRLYGMVRGRDYDYCFLYCASDGRLIEPAGQEVSVEWFARTVYADSAKRILEEIGQTKVESVLSLEQGIYAVNFTRNGEKWHIYLYTNDEGTRVECERGFEGSPAFLPGFATAEKKTTLGGWETIDKLREW